VGVRGVAMVGVVAGRAGRVVIICSGGDGSSSERRRKRLCTGMVVVVRGRGRRGVAVGSGCSNGKRSRD
jgi:hypothetical protein